jgi:hypothetical protein
LVCNPFDREYGEIKSLETIKDKLRSWLKFISSNTKRSFNFPPHITIVIINADKGVHTQKPCGILWERVGKSISKLHQFVFKITFNQCTFFSTSKGCCGRCDHNM